MATFSPAPLGTPTFSPAPLRKKRLSKLDAMWLGARIGFLDTARGIGQLTDSDFAGTEEEMAEQQANLHEAMDDPDYGGSVKAAYFGGLIADPVMWLFPLGRLKQVGTLGKASSLISGKSIAAGAAAGALGYDDPADSFSRAQMAGIGAVGGGLAAPLAKGVGKVWNEKVGDRAWNYLRHPAGAGSVVGGAVGYNMSDDETITGKMGNMLIGAAIGGATGGAPKMLDKAGVTDDLTGKIGRFVVPDYRLTDEWISRRAGFRGERKQIEGEFQTLLEKISGESLAVRKALYGMLTQPGKPFDPILEGKAGVGSEVRELVNKYGHELVDLGVLNPKTWADNQHSYLHTVYNKPRPDAKPVTGIEIRNIGDELKIRGIVKRITKKDFEAGRLPDADGPWEVVSVYGKKATTGSDSYKGLRGDELLSIRRQFTQKEKTEMGEVTDVMVSLDRTGKLLANDVAANRFFRDMANDPNVVSSGAPNAALGHVHRVPENKGFGQLGSSSSRDMYVNKETFDDLMNIGQLDTLTKFKKLIKPYRKLNAMWKGSKTIANPAVHFNNFVSNIFHFDNANGRARDVAKAFNDMRNKTADFRDAERLGVFGGFFTTELGKGSDEFFDLYKAGGKGATDNINLAASGIGLAEKIAKKAKNLTWDKAAKLYNAEDQIFRMALFRTERARNLANGLGEVESEQMAARKAREWFVDYERRSPLLDILREGPFPFMSYMYGIVPTLGETLAKKPLKFAKWAMFFEALNGAGANLSPGTDVERQRSLMTGEQGAPMYGMDFMPKTTVKLPEAISPQSRDDWYLQMGRMYPGGNIFGIEEQAKPRMGQLAGVPQALQPSFGAAGAIYDSLSGIDRFRGREIPGGWAERGKHLGAQFVPNLPIPNFPSYAGQKITRAQSEKYSPTKDVYTPTAAVLSGLGAKVTPVSTSKLRKRIKGNYSAMLRDLASRERAIRNEWRAGGMEDEDYREALRELRARKRELKRNRARDSRGK